MSEPREFLVIPPDEWNECGECREVEQLITLQGDAEIHVIEKSAYDQLLQRNGELEAEVDFAYKMRDEWAKNCTDKVERITELEKENDKLKSDIDREVKSYDELETKYLKLESENERLKRLDKSNTTLIFQREDELATLAIRVESYSGLLRELLEYTETELGCLYYDGFIEKVKAVLEPEK